MNAPIVGMVPSADGGGYFMVGADGGVFTFGDAKFEGSCPAIGGCAGGAAVAVMPDATGNGYWVVTAGGDVYPFGDAASYGEPGLLGVPVAAAVRSGDGGGYYILYPNGVVYAYGDAMNYGSANGEVGGLTRLRRFSPRLTAGGIGSSQPTDPSSPKATHPMTVARRAAPERVHHRRDGLVDRASERPIHRR